LLTCHVSYVILHVTMSEISIIGNDLIDYAKHEAEFSAQRGLLDELFPFIYVASKRMSLRAICRWLEETRRIQISVNAVSKAMRNQESYWARLVEDVAPAARTFADAHDVHPLVLLKEEGLFDSLESSEPFICASDDRGMERQFSQVVEAAGVLRNRWFALPEEAREQCWRHFAGEFAEAAGDTKEGGKDESGK